jgi:hypothetical protein
MSRYYWFYQTRADLALDLGAREQDPSTKARYLSLGKEWGALARVADVQGAAGANPSPLGRRGE